MRTRTTSERRTARARRAATVQLWMANLVVGVAVGTAWLAHVPESPKLSGLAWLFVVLGLVSCVVTLTLPLGAPFWLGAHWIARPRAVGIAQAFGWTFFQVLLYADTRIYNIFRYHFDERVIDILQTRGSGDAIHLGWQVWTAIVLGLGLGTGLQYLAWRAFLRRAERASRRRILRAVVRPALYCAAALALVVGLEKSIYAKAALDREREVTRLSQLFPFYAKVDLDELASRYLGVPETDRRIDRVALEEVRLDYPIEAPSIESGSGAKNVLLLVVDCWRKDMLDPEVSPNLWDWSRRGARVFDDHVSTGNATRFGLFGMLYGLHGSYWHPVLAERRSPVLVDALLAAGYELRVFSSASMEFPELRSTAWVRIRKDVHDDFPGRTPWIRDEQVAGAFERWMRKRARTADPDPFFGFVLLDSAHQTYSHPPDASPFRPSASEVDYLALSATEGPDEEQLELVFNRYRNSVFHVDDVAGRILRALETSGEAEETIVLVTGDHGEEFCEHGFFGHTSNFAPAQVAVPLSMRGPGIEPGIETRPTSHLDVPATILELAGADPELRGSWTLGGNLLAPPEPAEARRVVSGWKELGLWIPDGVLRVALSERADFDVELYDYDWNLQVDDQAIVERERETLERVAEECHRFLRLPGTGLD